MNSPTPPIDLASRNARVITINSGTTIHRFWTLNDGASRYDPIYYDRTLSGRLNAPDAGYGVLYAAKTPHGAFAESFLRTPGRRSLDAKLLAKKAYVELKIAGALRSAPATVAREQFRGMVRQTT